MIVRKVMFGPGATIATVGHLVNPDMREYMYTDPVNIGDNCGLGQVPSSVRENTVIGAGSVVTGDISANCVAAGNPCKVLREIWERNKKYYYRDRKILEEEKCLL